MEEPGFGVFGAGAGFEAGQGAEGFEFEHAGVGKKLGVAAEVGVPGGGVAGVLLDEPDAVEVVAGPALAVEKPDFLFRGRLGVLAHADESPAPGETGVGHVRVMPEDDGARGEEIIFVMAEILLGQDGLAAGGHDGERPRGEFDGPGVPVPDAVDDAGGVAGGVHADGDFLGDAGAGIDGLDEDKLVAAGADGDGGVVGVVGAGVGLGGVPQAVAAEDVPGAAALDAEMGFAFEEKVAFAAETGADDARSGVGGGDELDFAIGHPVTGGPSGVGDFFDHGGRGL